MRSVAMLPGMGNGLDGTDQDGIGKPGIGGTGGVGSTEKGANEITGLRLWLKGNAGIVIDTNAPSQTISQWSDQSGLGNHQINTTKSQQPAYVTNVANGNYAVAFSGSPVTLIGTGALTNLVAGTDVPYTVFAVARQFNAFNVAVASWGTDGGGGRARSEHRSNGGGQTRYTRQDDAGTIVTGTQDGSSISNFFLLGWVFTGTNCVMYANSSNSIQAANLGSCTHNNFRVGSWATNGINAGFLNGEIAELIVYNKELTSTEITTVTNYLVPKYNLF